MEKLTKFTRDGQDSYCFIQVKEVIFPTVPKSTVKSWLRELKITCKRCSPEEYPVFKNAMPGLSGAFGTINSSDLARLIELSQYKKIAKRQLTPPSVESTKHETETVKDARSSVVEGSKIDVIVVDKPCIPQSTNDKSGQTAKNFSGVKGGFSSATSEVNVTSSAVSLHNAAIAATTTITNTIATTLINTAATSENASACNNMNNTADLTVASVSLHKGTVCTTTITDDTTNACNSIREGGTNSASLTPMAMSSCRHEGNLTKFNSGNDESPRKRYTLAQEHVSVELSQELSELTEFYTSNINLSREGHRLTDTTMAKVNERIMCFLGFVKIYSPFEQLTLNLASKLKFLEEYVKYLTNVRKLMASTVSRNLSAILTVLKYTRRSMPDFEKLPEVIAIRNMQRQLAREENLTRKRKREGFSPSSKDETLLFSHILDVMRQLRDRYYNTAGIESSRHLHDFVLLCLYTRALPGRGKELRTLQFIDHNVVASEQQFQTGDSSVEEEVNALHIQSDGSVILTETDFKTVQSMGPSRIDLTDDEWLVYFIKIYTGKHRPTLLLGKSHKYFFVNRSGEAFLSSAGFSKYISDLFDRETGIRASTNKMRHAICTHFMSLPESQNQKLRESLAALLKHSVRHQQDTYNDQRRHEKVQMSRSFMRKQFVDKDLLEVEGNEMCAIKDSERPLASVESDTHADLLPQIGELVALLDPASTGPDNAFIFIAKVLRYTPDKDQVYLQELEKLNDSSDLYRAKCSSAWWENVRTLCYPIDIVYVSSEKAYQLRTTAEQIYNDIKSN